ncbi:hypothetical protein HCN83_07995 [Bacillus luteus]|uniref:Uncharacterized protein n=2 Tax=Alkalicoccus luteus TaxID=1237094 RepID=A0A969PNM0_9BACI|nr:hypothetical protein [Alkalicoccus luteus]
MPVLHRIYDKRKKQSRLPVVTLFSTNQSRFPDVSGVHVEAAQFEDSVPFRSANGIHARAEPDRFLKASREMPVSE